MALLTARRASWCLACAAAYGCEGSASLGRVELWLRACEGQAGCSATAPAEHFAVQGFFDPSVSRYAPHGFYAYWELPRADVRAVIELDVPTDGDAAAPLERYQVSYRELDGARLRFEASAASGRLALPLSFTTQAASDCSCDDAAFALRFSEPGADGEPGTGDDRVRELSLGQLSHADEGCARSLPQLDAEAGLRVTVSACGESAPPPAAAANNQASAGAPSWGLTCRGYGDCTSGGAVLADDGSQGGCGSSTDSSSSSGCADADDDTASDSSGCSDDSSQDSTSTHDSGCEGDTSSEDRASCAVTHRPSPPRRLGASFFGTGLPLAWVWLWHALRSSRRRVVSAFSARRGR